MGRRPTRRRAIFEWPDAWVFASLRGATDDSGQVDFSKVVTVADMLDHAIVTADEVRRALGKLHASGARGGLFSIVDNTLRVLNSPRTRLPIVDGLPDTAFVTEDFMSRAQERYLQTTRAGAAKPKRFV